MLIKIYSDFAFKNTGQKSLSFHILDLEWHGPLDVIQVQVMHIYLLIYTFILFYNLVLYSYVLYVYISHLIYFDFISHTTS